MGSNKTGGWCRTTSAVAVHATVLLFRTGHAAGWGAEPNGGPLPSKDPSSPYDPEFHVNVGRAIDTVVKDIPHLFQRDADYSVYADDMVFTESIWGHATLHGVSTYQRAIKWTCLIVNWSFLNPQLEVTSVVHRSKEVAQIWWRFTGTPRQYQRLLWGTPPGPVVFEGVSLYHFNRKGFIASHDITNMVPPPEAFRYIQTLQALFGRPASAPATM